MTILESMQSVVESDCQLQELVEEVEQAVSLVMLILTALQLGRAIAVKVVEEILNERGQAPEEECAQCEKCKAKLESKGLLPREILTLIGWIKWRRQVRRCPNGCKGSQVAPTDELIGLGAYQKTRLVLSVVEVLEIDRLSFIILETSCSKADGESANALATLA